MVMRSMKKMKQDKAIGKLLCIYLDSVIRKGLSKNVQTLGLTTLKRVIEIFEEEYGERPKRIAV